MENVSQPVSFVFRPWQLKIKTSDRTDAAVYGTPRAEASFCTSFELRKISLFPTAPGSP
jgi:hypothetical protein